MALLHFVKLQFTQAFFKLSVEFTVCRVTQTRKMLTKRRPKSTIDLAAVG